jgi:hypothetical protein
VPSRSEGGIENRGVRARCIRQVIQILDAACLGPSRPKPWGAIPVSGRINEHDKIAIARDGSGLQLLALRRVDFIAFVVDNVGFPA